MQNKVAFYIKVYNIEFGGKQVPARSRHSRSYLKIDFPVPARSRIFPKMAFPVPAVPVGWERKAVPDLIL